MSVSTPSNVKNFTAKNVFVLTQAGSLGLLDVYICCCISMCNWEKHPFAMMDPSNELYGNINCKVHSRHMHSLYAH